MERNFHYPNLCLLTKETCNKNQGSKKKSTGSFSPPITTGTSVSINRLTSSSQYVVSHHMTELMRPVGWTEITNAPSIISRAKPCSICIRMTTGRLREYNRSALLHCGISDSQGSVHHFDENGYGCGVWQECVSVALLSLEQSPNMNAISGSGSLISFVQEWDKSLGQFHALQKDNGSLYHDTDNNCFHFVVGFLRHVSSNSTDNNERSSSIAQSLACLQNVSIRRVEKYYIRPSMKAMETYLELLQNIENENGGKERDYSESIVFSTASTVELYSTYCNQMNKIKKSLRDLTTAR